MRFGDFEAHVELRFDCGTQGTLKRSDQPGLQHLTLETVTGHVEKTVTGSLILPQGLHAICINYQGALLARPVPSQRLIIVPPRSVTFIRAGSRMVLQAARGAHSSQILSWPGGLTPLLDSWISARAGGKGAQPNRGAACKSIDPHFQDVLERFERAKVQNPDAAEPLLLSVAYELVARVMFGFDEFQLAAIPSDLPETIYDLTAEVRASPAQPWPLKDAANKAGYSPFHFSRVFKSLVGYGFHEFVDRCRTECAVEMLATTDNAVDLVASSCGFGTTQGLRESVKEYLGLVPSEIRNFPSDIAIATEA